MPSFMKWMKVNLEWCPEENRFQYKQKSAGKAKPAKTPMKVRKAMQAAKAKSAAKY